MSGAAEPPPPLGRPPLRVPVVPLSIGRQVLILALALAAIIPLPLLGAAPSVYSPRANPPMAFVGALVAGLITFTGLHLWTAPVAALHLFTVAVWCSVVDGLGPVGALTLSGMIAAVALHVCVRAHVREDHQFVAATLTAAGSFLALLTLSGLLQGFDPLARLSAIAQRLVEVTFTLLSQMFAAGGPLRPSDAQFLNRLQVEQLPLWVWLLPGNAAATFGLLLWLLGRVIRSRLPGTAERLPPFWAFEISFVYAGPVVVLCLLDAASVVWHLTPLRLVCDNLLWVLLNLYWLGGLAVGHCMTLQWRFGPFLRAWVWIVMLFLAPYLVAAVGLFDTWFHFRRMTAKLARR